jgi:hypothetical protein
MCAMVIFVGACEALGGFVCVFGADQEHANLLLEDACDLSAGRRNGPTFRRRCSPDEVIESVILP